MRAAITAHYGPADVIELREVPRPAVAAGQIQVAVYATPVTAGDRRLRAADFPGIGAVIGRLMIGLTGPRAEVQGTMFAGRVVAVGEAVTEFAVGDDVFGSVNHGAYAEYLTVSADGPVAKMPPGLDHAAAAEVPYGGVTALRFLRDIGRVQPGERVLILGASGGVGRYAVQIARHFGAEVTAVCSTAHLDQTRALGAHHVIDYTVEDALQRDARYDVIFDIADATSFGACRARLTPTGRYLTLYMTTAVLLRGLLSRLTGGPRAHSGVALGRKADLAELAELLEIGALRATVAARFALSDIRAAHAHAEGERAGGVIVTVDAAA